jgi:hypothetical protein
MLNLSWINCGNGTNWCPFDTVNLSDVDAKGVYIVWHEGNPGRVVYVGQGDIVARIATHRNDKRITAYEKQGRLRVTWASVPAAQRDGVERYLADKWNPLVGDAHPDVRPIAVNSPWG